MAKYTGEHGREWNMPDNPEPEFVVIRPNIDADLLDTTALGLTLDPSLIPHGFVKSSGVPDPALAELVAPGQDFDGTLVS